MDGKEDCLEISEYNENYVQLKSFEYVYVELIGYDEPEVLEQLALEFFFS
jgi:hypothetical protein